MHKHLRRRPSAAMCVASLALFAALGGVGVAATGDPWILGQSNSASTPTELTAPVNGSGLAISNSSTGANSTPLTLTAAPGRAPMKVNRTTRVTNLNADLLDGVNSTAFLRQGVATSQNVSSAGGLVDVTNTGFTNGVLGRTTWHSAAGVYGENTSEGGYGVAGRVGRFAGKAVYGDNLEGGWAGFFEDSVHIGGLLDVTSNVEVSNDLNLGGVVRCAGCVGPEDISGTLDADTLDGIDSTALMQGRGGAAQQAVAMLPGQSRSLGSAMFGFLRVEYSCPVQLGNNGTITLTNSSTGLVNVFIDGGWSNPDFRGLVAGGSVSYPAAPNGESLHVQAQGALGVLTLDTGTVHRGSTDCHTQAQATLTR